jgi:hypothetical protein
MNDRMSLIFIPVCQTDAFSFFPTAVLGSRRVESNCLVTHPNLTHHHVLKLVYLLSNTLFSFQHAFFCVLLGFFVMYVCWSVIINWCWDSMFRWVWNLPLCLYWQHVILFQLLLSQVSPCSLMFWLMLRSHRNWSSSLIQCCVLLLQNSVVHVLCIYVCINRTRLQWHFHEICLFRRAY